uniref:Uncharacterized protein n=1 Tax=Arundo donax TaxID=35708 RepID=A0A0A8YG88_ARUDO
MVISFSSSKHHSMVKKYSRMSGRVEATADQRKSRKT